MTAKAKKLKGASPLHLDNIELRRELYRADAIILNAVSMMSVANQLVLQSKLVDCHVTSADDPLAEDTRLAAMHRITPKRDYSKLALIVLAVVFGLAWLSTQTEMQILQAEAAQIQGR